MLVVRGELGGNSELVRGRLFPNFGKPDFPERNPESTRPLTRGTCAGAHVWRNGLAGGIARGYTSRSMPSKIRQTAFRPAENDPPILDPAQNPPRPPPRPRAVRPAPPAASR